MKKKKILFSIISIVLGAVTTSFLVSAQDLPVREGWEECEDTLKDIEEDSSFNINMPKDNCNVDSVSFSWGRDEEEYKVGLEYTVYSKITGGINEVDKNHYRPVPIEGTINVLNIYPGLVNQRFSDETYKLMDTNRLEMWMTEPALERIDDDSTEYDVLDKSTGKEKKYNYIRNKAGDILSNGYGILDSQTESETEADGKTKKIARDNNGKSKVTFVTKKVKNSTTGEEFTYYVYKKVPKKKDANGNDTIEDNKDEFGRYIIEEGKESEYTLPKINVTAITTEDFDKSLKEYGKEYLEITKGKKTEANLTKEEQKYLDSINPYKKGDSKYAYDVIMYGAWDCNGSKIPSDYAIDYFEKYIKDGYGFLAGHDTIGYTWGIERGLGRLRDKFNIKVSNMRDHKDVEHTKPYFKADDGYDGVNFGVLGHKVRIKNYGLLTNYPWYIAGKETKLDIPYSHSTNNFAYGDIWMDYGEIGKDDTRIFLNEDYAPKELWGASNFYLTTQDNTAMIQTGHSLGNATPDEQKVTANTLCYLHQLTAKKSIVDKSVQDLTAPEIPEIEDISIKNGADVTIKETSDLGTEYSYIVKEHNYNTNKTVKSRAKKATITSGVKSYLVYIDNNENTDIASMISNSDKDNKDHTTWNLENMGIKVIDASEVKNGIIKSSFGNLANDFYVHVAAMDNNYNISGTNHKKFEFKEILGIKTESESVIKGNDAWADIYLNNIDDENKSFLIHNPSEIVKQQIVINYDYNKLKYRGEFGLNRCFTVFDEIVDEKNGKITLNIYSSNISKLDIIALKFETLISGDAEVSIESGVIYSKDKGISLLPVQMGKCNLKIDD